MTRTKIVRAFFQRIAKLNAPEGGKNPPGGEPTDVLTARHEPDAELAEEAAHPVESGLIQRKF
jgi:hypothetical protein